MTTENIDEIEKTINKAIDYIKSNQKEDGAVILNEDKRWNVWETTNSILAVQIAKKNEKEFLKKALHFLLNAQREDGSFYVTVSSAKGQYCMETTSISVLVLATAKKDISKGLQFLRSNQNLDGSWEIGIPDMLKHRLWPSITGFVLQTLSLLEISSNEISKGIEFLLKKQQDDGSWGSHWIYYDSPYYATHVILSALKLQGLEESESYKKAICFIKNNQNKDGSWSEYTTDKPRPSISLRTALALHSLLVSADHSSIQSIKNGVQWLVKNQNSDGSWDGGYYVNWPNRKEDIFATCIAIRTLKKYQLYLTKDP